MAPSVARESTLHCKLDSQLHWAAVRSIFWVGGKWIMEIPVKGDHNGACMLFVEGETGETGRI
jgi:hypothetical protein